MSQWEVRLRLFVVRAAILGTFLVLVVQLWQLQIVRGQEFQQRADRNRFRVEAVDAPRGVFYDRNGRLLVRNVPKFTVSLIPARLPDKPEERLPVLERLSSLLGIPLSKRISAPVASREQMHDVRPPEPAVDLESLLDQAEKDKKSPYEPILVAANADRQVALILLEEASQMPGVVVQVEPTRQYLDGPLFSHILGYQWRMPEEQVDAYLSLPGSDYTANDMVGYSGLERTMEAELHGHRGRRHVEVDVFEREIAVLAYEPPQAGHSLVLNLDRELQARTEEYLREGMLAVKGKSASAIVMSPRTGEVLALVSLPTYDNNLFAQGKTESYQGLLDDPSQPMFNRAISGQYPPGSTFKIIPATAALQEKVVNTSTTFDCEGTMYLDVGDVKWPFYCWIRKNNWRHGELNIVQALAQSCDIFFYKMVGGYEEFPGLGLDSLTYYERLFGMGERTGIELEGEAKGLVPTTKYKRLNYQESWTTGDTYNAAIGQGFVLATPLQMLNALCAIANGGTLYKPQLVREIIDADGNVVRPFQPQVIRRLNLSPSVLQTVREGLRLAVTEGTAPLANLPEVAVAGKTGSAEFGEPNAKGERPTHAWFAAYAPFENPEVAVIVFVEGGGEGSSTAAPIVARILRYYFGLPASETPTTP